jgi:hypothetical protein
MRTLTRSYETLVKDKEIIAAEVMHEYNEGVCPTISFAVLSLTHESRSLCTHV